MRRISTALLVKAAFGAHYFQYGPAMEEELFGGFVSMHPRHGTWSVDSYAVHHARMHAVLVGDHEPQGAVGIDDVEPLDGDLAEPLLAGCDSAATAMNTRATALKAAYICSWEIATETASCHGRILREVGLVE